MQTVLERPRLDGIYATEHGSMRLNQWEFIGEHAGAVYLSDFVVDYQHRGEGHGRRMLNAVIEAARERGLAITLQVFADNEVALNLYRSVGFVVTSEWTWASTGRKGYTMRLVP